MASAHRHGRRPRWILQMVRAFLERYFHALENEDRRCFQQDDKVELRDLRFKGRGLDMKTMTAAIAIAKKRQLVPVRARPWTPVISEVKSSCRAPED